MPGSKGHLEDTVERQWWVVVNDKGCEVVGYTQQMKRLHEYGQAMSEKRHKRSIANHAVAGEKIKRDTNAGWKLQSNYQRK